MVPCVEWKTSEANKAKRDDGNLWPTGVVYINFSLSPFEYENQEGE